ncbi:TonB-dependent receptor [Sphingosinicella terrae]|uniref:TonB-dependent receptor n=1 Tax=Sphingosinicella terrae TaxID=2172047 RepID=UPI00254983F5|nr:TonB-dependent receptor [Sphingosinicella terrae]
MKGMGTALLGGTALALIMATPAAAQAGDEACAGAPDGSSEAQACAAAANSSAQGFEEIVVTARRRAENLQDVPDSITAFSADDIAERRLERIDDFLAVTSNVRINNDQDTATNNIAIRGLGANRNQAAAVAFSVDGVVLPDSDAFTIDLSDVERVEVLKGPQGALYGRGAIAGAINITTRRPTNEWQGEARASYQSADSWRVFGAVSGPIVEDFALARLSLSHRDSDGYIVNQLTGDGIDRNRQTRATGRLILMPAPGLEIDFRAAYTDERGGSTWFSRFDVLGQSGGEITGEIAALRPAQDTESLSERQITDLSMLINYDFGFATLTSITAYNDIDVFFRQDLDISEFPLVPNAQQSRDTEAFSQELRLTSPGNRRLRYILGGYYQHSERSIETAAVLDVCLFIGSCFSGPGGGFVSAGTVGAPLADNRITFNQYAVFGQVNFDLTPQIELTAALRYDVSDGRIDDFFSNFETEESFEALQPKFSIAWRPSDQVMLYATYSQGFKSGNFNPAAAGPTFPRILGEETSRNYELGFKTTLLDRRLIFNGAAFFTEHLDPQIFQLDPATISQGSLNANKVEITGFELELNARPFRGFELNAAFGYLDAEIVDFDGTALYVGQQMPNAPEFTLNLGAQYRFPVTDAIDLRARVDAAVVGRQSFQDFQFPQNDELYLYQRSYGTVDAQLALEGSNWTATLFVRNLFERDYATSAFSRYIFAVALVPLNSDAVQSDPGRIFGAEIGFRF